MLEERLFVWGEAPPKPKRGGRRKNGLAPFPYDAGFTALREALTNLGLDFVPDDAREDASTAWLPTVSEQPYPSSALIGEFPEAEGETTLAPWKVSGLFLDPQEWLELLTARPQHGVVAGRDLRFWLAALREAGSLVTRQRFLPGLTERAGEWFARWQPVWLGEDADLLEALASDMPAAARALTRDAEDGAPDTPPRRAVEAFVAATLDHLVRSHADDGLPAVPGGVVAGNVVERWLAALRIPDAHVPGDDESLRQLAELVRDWRRPVDQAAMVPFRLCFRLEEPAPSKDEPPPRRGRGRHGRQRPGRDVPRPGQRRWYVRFLLQSAEDPNLLVPTADAWIIRGRKAAALARSGTDVHAALLASMVQAAGVDPRIEESLRSRKPSGFSLDARGAHDFLTRTAPALTQAGFGVILPPWWTEYGTTAQHLCVRAKVHTPERRELDAEPSLDEQVSFDWEISVGGRPLSGRDLDELARLKEPLVNVRGHWVVTHIEEIHAAQMFWKNRRAGEVTARELVRMALGSADTSAGIRFAGVDASGWLGDLLRQLTDKNAIEPLPAPEGFEGALRPYQERGYAWLDMLGRHGLGSCLADDMGLGKTIQTLALFERRRAAGEDRPVLLVCPTSVLTNWQREASRFTPGLGVTVHHGVGRARGYDLQQRAYAHSIVLTSYALLHRDLEDLHMVQWSGVVLDEAQNIKNPSTKQSQAVRTLKADYRIALTGTPVENHVGDLWSIMDFLNPGFLGTRQEFKRSYFVPIQAFRDREASERLNRIAGPFILRRLKSDRSIISDLPEKNEMKVFCTLTTEQGRLYTSVVEEAEKRIRDSEGIERRGVILAALTKLKQVCNHPAHYLGDESEIDGRSGKLTRLTEMLEEVIEAGDRSLVFTQFVEMGSILQRHLAEELGREVLFLHGGVSKRRRDTLIERFQAEESDAPPIFVLSLKAGGLGLNLTAANHVFHFDRWWNPAVENQATDRAFRIGQTRNVQVHKYVCAGTLEERIDEMIERKRTIAEDIVGTGEAWITELSDEELHDMFALRKDAVRE